MPHNPIPLKDDGKMPPMSDLMKYLMGLVPVLGPAFALAFLFLLVGVGYGIFKAIRACCCRNRKEREVFLGQVVFPAIAYFFFFVFILVGVGFGIQNNPHVTRGISDISFSISDLGDSTVNLANNLLDSIQNIVNSIPAKLDSMLDQISGLPELGTDLISLSADVNSSVTSVQNIQAAVNNISAGNLSVIIALQRQLGGIANNSVKVIGSVSSLTVQIADKLNGALNSTEQTIHEHTKDLNSTVEPVISTANDLLDKVKDIVKSVKGYLTQAKDYDSKRAAAITAIFVIVLLSTLAVVLGFVVKYKFIFNIIAGIGFALGFLLWFLGGIHLALGMTMGDACPVIDPFVMSVIPSGQIGNVIHGCMDGETIIEGLNITAFNLSSVFDYKGELNQFTSFMTTFNFSQIDGYLSDIDQLGQYNLSAEAANLTVASFGWNQSTIYTTLQKLNNLTTPDYFTLSNYSTCNPNNYPSVKNQVNGTKVELGYEIQFNKTIYERVDTVKQQMNDVQTMIDNLLANMTVYEGRFDGIRNEISNLTTTNITRAIAIMDGLQTEIDEFFETGNCSFIGTNYRGILDSVCGTLKPAIDILMSSQFLVGIALIPLVILAEYLSFRIHYLQHNRVTFGDLKDLFFGNGDVAGWDDEDKKRRKSDKKSMQKAQSMQKPASISFAAATAGPSAPAYDEPSQMEQGHVQQNYTLNGGSFHSAYYKLDQTSPVDADDHQLIVPPAPEDDRPVTPTVSYSPRMNHTGQDGIELHSFASNQPQDMTQEVQHMMSYNLQGQINALEDELQQAAPLEQATEEQETDYTPSLQPVPSMPKIASGLAGIHDEQVEEDETPALRPVLSNPRLPSIHSFPRNGQQ